MIYNFRVSSSQRQNSQRKFNNYEKNRRNDKVKRWFQNKFNSSFNPFTFIHKESYCSEFDGKKVVGKPVSFLPESPKMRLFVKDWVAQWDPLYNAWFYYHPGTGWVAKNKPGDKCFLNQHFVQITALGTSRRSWPTWLWTARGWRPGTRCLIIMSSDTRQLRTRPGDLRGRGQNTDRTICFSLITISKLRNENLKWFLSSDKIW